MNREKWDLIKTGKSFNVNVFRRGLAFLIISLILSCIFAIFTFYIYITEPERDYYATNGAMPPIKLRSLVAPNYSSTALMEPDPPTVNEERVIPQ